MSLISPSRRPEESHRRELFYIIRTGKGEMPPEGDRAKDDDIWNMVNYVRSLAKSRTISRVVELPRALESHGNLVRVSRLQSNCEVTWSRRGWRQAIFFFFFRAFTETEERATPSSDSVSKTRWGRECRWVWRFNSSRRLIISSPDVSPVLQRSQSEGWSLRSDSR